MKTMITLDNGIKHVQKQSSLLVQYAIIRTKYNLFCYLGIHTANQKEVKNSIKINPFVTGLLYSESTYYIFL